MNIDYTKYTHTLSKINSITKNVKLFIQAAYHPNIISDIEIKLLWNNFINLPLSERVDFASKVNKAIINEERNNQDLPISTDTRFEQIQQQYEIIKEQYEQAQLDILKYKNQIYNLNQKIKALEIKVIPSTENNTSLSKLFMCNTVDMLKKKIFPKKVI